MPEWRSTVLISRRRLRSLKVTLPTRLVDQGFQRFPAVEGGGEEAAKGDIGPGDLEHVPAADQTGPGLHLLGRAPRRPRPPR